MRLLNIIFCWEKQPDRIDRIKKYWGKNTDLLFLSNKSNNEMNIIGFDTPDGYKNLTYSNLELFKNFDNYVELYDWFILNDSDSYLFINKIKSVLINYNSDDLICLGRKGIYNDNNDHLNCKGLNVKLPVDFADGSCVILSNFAIQKLIEYIKTTSNITITDAADVSLGFWLRECNINLIDISNLIMHESPKYIGYNKENISYHYCFEEEFYYLNEEEKKEKKENFIKGEKFPSLANNYNIFYCNTHDVNNFFKNTPENDFILVSHNSDGKITDNPKEYDADVKIIPENLIKWYGQMCAIVILK